MNEQALDLIEDIWDILDDIVWDLTTPKLCREKTEELRRRIDSLRDQERDDYYREI